MKRPDIDVLVWAEATADGGITVEGHDMGSTVQEWHGDDDYEYRIEISGTQMRALALALIKERYSGVNEVFTEIRDLCERNDIKYKLTSWT